MARLLPRSPRSSSVATAGSIRAPAWAGRKRRARATASVHHRSQDRSRRELSLPYRLTVWLRCLFAVALATPGGAAQAQVSGGLGVDSDYRYRGVSLSRSQPSARATVNYDAPERWYTGALLTRAALLPSDTYTQVSGY